jgi:hypothetical protein
MTRSNALPEVNSSPRCRSSSRPWKPPGHADCHQVRDNANFYVRKGNRKATLGQSLTVKKGHSVSVVIRFRTPDANNCDPDLYSCQPPQVDHVDLIQGNVTGLIPPGDPAYGQDTNPTTQVVARFDLSEFELIDGWYTTTLTLSNLQNSVYFRLRGTNQPLLNLEVNGDPYIDLDAYQEALCRGGDPSACNTPQKAWDDLWFYSNPIFVNVN